MRVASTDLSSQPAARAILVLVAGALLLASSCATGGPWVWADALGPEALRPPPYRVMPGDRLVVSVWNQPGLSGEVLVRPDGNITLPLVGDVLVLGRTPSEAAGLLATRLDGLVSEPRVAVALGGNRSPTVSVVGEVRQAGAFELRPGDGVLDVLARAGGLTEFADRSRVFVLRRDAPARVRFDYDKISRRAGGPVGFLLQDGDVVVVE